MVRIKLGRVIAIVLPVAVVAAASFRIYAISEGSGGWAMWNASEAYLFVKVNDRGYSASGLEYPWILFKEYVIGGFAAVELPKDERAHLVVIRATSSGVERHVVKLDRTEDGGPGGDPGEYTPLEGRIYAFYPALIGHFMQDGQVIANDMNDGLGWWAGDHFEKATLEERRRLDGINRLTTVDFENDSNGWSRRVFVAAPTNRAFTIAVGDRFQILISNMAKEAENTTVSIALLRPGKQPEKIGDFSSRQERIGRSEYKQIFQ